MYVYIYIWYPPLQYPPSSSFNMKSSHLYLYIANMLRMSFACYATAATELPSLRSQLATGGGQGQGPKHHR